MKVLIVKCYTTQAEWGKQMIESFTGHIKRHEPSAGIDILNIMDGDTPPDPSQYRLVIFSGGTFNLLTDDTFPPWVDSALEFIRAISSMPIPVTKLVGVCWGHQAVQFALGGKLGVLEDAPRIGVEEINLTPEGQKFLGGQTPTSTLNLHKFHKRYVTEPAPNFTPLATNNEILLSNTGQILTMQSHPELSEKLSRGILEGADGGYTSSSIMTDAGVKLLSVNSEHAGAKVWDVIMEWCK
ncbi:class I glutamine amidotransferase-like protein [Aspergillus stella-maris]|uniref:class I glutamine amidotransferase-like protein n=1 Tax=Aspergillus stella-maris TaxID=1810926 RepID=UPI003CCC9B3B